MVTPSPEFSRCWEGNVKLVYVLKMQSFELSEIQKEQMHCVCWRFHDLHYSFYFYFFLSLCISYRTGVCEGTLRRHCLSGKCSHTSLHTPTQCSPSLSHMVQRLHPLCSAHGHVCCHCDCKRCWEEPSLLFSAGEWWRGVLLRGQQQLLCPHQSNVHNRSAHCAG